MGGCHAPRVGRICILTCVKTGEKKKFDNLHKADIFLGYTPGFISQKRAKGIDMVLRRDDKLFYTIEYGEVRRLYPVNGSAVIPEKKFAYEPQLCWTCGKCYGDCSWSLEFKPVKGWKAEPTIIRNGGSFGCEDIPSYRVEECPEYVKG